MPARAPPPAVPPADPSAPVQPAVDIRSVHKHYGAVHALAGVEFSIAQGEFFGLLGPNGAGKSTLINIMAGLTRPDSGTVTVLGHDVRTHYRDARRRLGVVPQELVYDPFFTPRETLLIQAGYFGIPAAQARPWVDELLETLGLSAKANAGMRALSGGMKRRVLIAQALVHRPPVLVLDEPTAGVDVELRQALWIFVRRLHDEGHTVVLTTHYLEEAESLCDRIAILDHGGIAALDTKDGLLARGLRKHLRVTTERPAGPLPPALEDLVVHREGCELELQLNRDRHSVVDIIDALRAAGVVVIDLHVDEADLEDVFVDLTAGGGQR